MKQLRPRWGLRLAKRFAKQNGRMLVAPVVSGGHLSRARSFRRPFIPRPKRPGAARGALPIKLHSQKRGAQPRASGGARHLSPHHPIGKPLRIYQPPQPRPTNPQPSCPGEPANLPHPPKSRLTFHIQRKSRGKPFYINSKPCASNVQKNGPKTRPGRPG